MYTNNYNTCINGYNYEMPIILCDFTEKLITQF